MEFDFDDGILTGTPEEMALFFVKSDEEPLVAVSDGMKKKPGRPRKATV